MQEKTTYCMFVLEVDLMPIVDAVYWNFLLQYRATFCCLVTDTCMHIRGWCCIVWLLLLIVRFCIVLSFMALIAQ
jgi:hypothetical protein